MGVVCKRETWDGVSEVEEEALIDGDGVVCLGVGIQAEAGG